MVALRNFFDTIQGFIELGGPVLYAVLVVLLLMWTFILERYWFLLVVFPKRRRDILAAWEARLDTTSWYAHRIRERWVSEAAVELNQGILFIKTCVAVCPLLGLLGTVTGMILVFDVMGIVGTGNPRAMADGVAQATIPTMSGMVAALSGIYFSDKLERTVNEQVEQLEDLLQHH